MEPAQPQLLPASKPRDGRALVAKIFIGLAIVTGFVLVVYRCHTEQSNGEALQTRVIALKDTNNLLIKLVLSKETVISGLNSKLSAGEIAAAKSRETINKAIDERNQAIAMMSQQERKIEALKVAFKNGDINAQRLRDSLSSMPVFTDEEANRLYLELSNERDMWRDSTRAVYEQLGRVEYEKSELELELNHEKALKAETRTFVQDERAKASSNIIKQIVNAGKIRLLGKIDAKLAEKK